MTAGRRAEAAEPPRGPPRRRPRALLFDWDNTLVDSWPVIHAALADTFTAMGHRPWTLAETRARVRHSLRDSFPALFGERWEAARDVFYDSFERRHIEALAELPGASEMLAALAGEGVALGVVSNKSGHLLRREADHLAWTPRFGALVGAGDAARDKPAPEAAELALAGMGQGGLAGGEVWFVGDSNIDMELAHTAGFLPVLLHAEDDGAPEFASHPPALSLPDCRALAALVSRL